MLREEEEEERKANKYFIAKQTFQCESFSFSSFPILFAYLALFPYHVFFSYPFPFPPSPFFFLLISLYIFCSFHIEVFSLDGVCGVSHCFFVVVVVWIFECFTFLHKIFLVSNSFQHLNLSRALEYCLPFNETQIC